MLSGLSQNLESTQKVVFSLMLLVTHVTEEWYNITWEILEANGGGGLLAQHGNSLIALLQHVYPGFD